MKLSLSSCCYYLGTMYSLVVKLILCFLSFFGILTHHPGASYVALVVRNPPANVGDIRDAGSITGLARSPGGGHGNSLQYSCLKNPIDRGAWRATVHRVTHGAGHDWSDLVPMHEYDVQCWKINFYIVFDWLNKLYPSVCPLARRIFGDRAHERKGSQGTSSAFLPPRI